MRICSISGHLDGPTPNELLVQKTHSGSSAKLPLPLVGKETWVSPYTPEEDVVSKSIAKVEAINPLTAKQFTLIDVTLIRSLKACKAVYRSQNCSSCLLCFVLSLASSVYSL